MSVHKAASGWLVVKTALNLCKVSEVEQHAMQCDVSTRLGFTGVTLQAAVCSSQYSVVIVLCS